MRDMRDSGIDWLGSIPSDWKLRKIKFCFDIVKDIIGYEGPPVLACTNTGIKVKDLTYGSGQIAKDYSNYQWVRPGDFVMNNLDLVGGWIDVSTLEGVTSPDYRVFRAKGPEYDNGYYRHLFQLCYMDRIFRDTSNVVEGMGWGRMQAPVFKNFVVPVPSLGDQRRISSYLDRRCERVDNAIATAEDSITEYQILRRSIVYGAATAGLRKETPGKATGLDWLPSIPDSWSLVRGKDVLSILNRPVRDDDGIITCFRDGVATLRSNRRKDGFTVSLKEIGYQGIEPGDLIVHGMDGFAGTIGISDSRGKGSPVLNVMDSTQDKRFVMYYLRALAYREVYLALATGIRVRSCNLSWNKIAVLPIALPPLEEQIAIADYLDEKCAQIDAAIAAKRSIIDELKAYKKSLVYEYVTGKREVPS